MATDLRFTIEIDGIQKTITSVSDANKVIKDLTKSFVLLKQAGQDVGKTLTQISEATQVKNNLLMVSKGAVQTAQSLQGTQTASANASMALLNLNYVIRDSPYFFQNFALGLLAVGNNLNPLIDSFNRLRTEAIGKNLTTFALLKQALVGGAGISIAFSVVVTAIQSFVFWMAKSNREANELEDSFSGILDSMIQISEVGSQFGVTPEKLSSRIGAIEQTESMYRDKVERISGSPMSKGTQFNEYFINLFASKQLSAEEEKRLEAYQKVLEKLREMKDELKAQYEVAKILKEAGFDEIKKEEKVKKLKEDQLKSAQSRADIEGGMAGSPKTFARRGFFAGSETNKRFGMKQSENTKAFGLNQPVKDLGIELEMGKIAAQELGNAISSAFEQGTISLNKFINSLIAAISKMLILRAVTAFLTGGTSAIAMPGVPSIPGVGNPSLGKSVSNSVVNVQGKISVNKNKFVVDIENARDSYNNNAKLVTIGRD